DGVFTYLLGTPDGIGMAKDRWAIKPLAVVAADDGIAIATEEQALRSLYVDEVDVRNFDEPLMTHVWGLRPDEDEGGLAAWPRTPRSPARPAVARGEAWTATMGTRRTSTNP